MSRYRTMPLPELLAGARTILERTPQEFGALTPTQLNWQPGAGRWSVAQCLDHLMTAHAEYFPIFEQILAGRYPATLWRRLTPLSGFWGRFLIDAVSPESPRKHKAPKIFAPASSAIGADVVDRFLAQQRQVIDYLERTAASGHDPAQVVITSPVAAVVTYSWLDALRVIVAHEERHLEQARRVVRTPGFPS